MTQKTAYKIIIALVVLAAAFPAPGLTASAINLSDGLGRAVLSAGQPLVAVQANSGLPAGNVTVAAYPAGHASSLIAETPRAAVLACQNFGLPGAADGVMFGPGAVNLNQPANCFNLDLRQPQFLSSNINLQVRPLAAAPVKILIAAAAGLWFGHISVLPSQSLPAVAATVLAATAAWAFDRKRMLLKNKVINPGVAVLNLLPARLEILRC